MRGSQQDNRAHIHCGAARPDGETVFAAFRRQGVDVQIEPDVGALIRQGHTLYRSAQGAILMPETVGVEFFRWVNAWPTKTETGVTEGIMIYLRPFQWQVDEWPHDHVSCANCSMKLRLGTCVCLSC